MLSNLTNTVVSIIGDRKEEIAKKVYKYEDKLNDIERRLDKGVIDSSQAINEVKGLLRYHLKNEDYRKIEKHIN